MACSLDVGLLSSPTYSTGREVEQNEMRSYYYAHQPESTKGFPADAVVREDAFAT